ncbi:hypothetical protein MUK42_36087 [Musa troglodytarum]|uniref:Uncharacterized protein n=1 Tax=Musa troglodytarum TaxID=320322 RepID=A0A9E7EFU5_9LILI|nr:hypothetical protein MUK42_36087 [Musa troglodytarum]
MEYVRSLDVEPEDQSPGRCLGLVRRLTSFHAGGSHPDSESGSEKANAHLPWEAISGRVGKRTPRNLTRPCKSFGFRSEYGFGLRLGLKEHPTCPRLRPSTLGFLCPPSVPLPPPKIPTCTTSGTRPTPPLTASYSLPNLLVQKKRRIGRRRAGDRGGGDGAF